MAGECQADAAFGRGIEDGTCTDGVVRRSDTACLEEEPPFFKISDTHYAKTWLLDPRAPKVEKPEAIRDLHKKIQLMTEKGGAYYVEQ